MPISRVYMLYNIFFTIAYMPKKQYLCTRNINLLNKHFMSTKQTNKLTKNVSTQKQEERNIVNFTKPFKTKEQWVALVYNKTRGFYELRGIDCYDSPIRYDYPEYSMADAQFYNELCWILNSNIMADSAEQRANPEKAYLNK